MNESGDIRCDCCGKMTGSAHDHRDRYRKPIKVCRGCLEQEVAGIINDRHAAEGDIRKYNAARRAEQKYRRYYAREGEDRRPLP